MASDTARNAQLNAIAVARPGRRLDRPGRQHQPGNDGAAVGVRALRAGHDAAGGQSPGPVRRRDDLVQPGARRLAWATRWTAVEPPDQPDPHADHRSRAASRARPSTYQQSIGSEPILILAAIIAIYLVLGILYESYAHPMTILSTLPSAGLGAVLALMLFNTEFSLIALIGVFLLIGIVKKNAIMMIDFAIEAERTEGLEPQGGDLQGLPAAIPADHDDDDGGPARRGAARGRLRRRRGTAPPARHRDRRRLVVSQLLTLYTTPVVYLYIDQARAWRCLRSYPAGAAACDTRARARGSAPSGFHAS